MVRYHWHVEDGHGCLVPPGKLSCSHTHGVLHAGIEFEIAGQSGLVEALITTPASYLEITKDVGVALAHGQEADDWKGPLMNSLADSLAKEGYVVVRYYCKQKEQRRQRIFEKALDACATSPFARHVSRWVLAGVGNGARVAAAVGTRCRGNLAGFILIGYPLKEPMPSNKGGPAPDSRGPLLRLEAPVLFVMSSCDSFCSVPDLQNMEQNMPSRDKRLVYMQNFGMCTIPHLSKVRLRTEVQGFQCTNGRHTDSQFQKSYSPKESSASDQELSHSLGKMSPSIQCTPPNELMARVTSSSTRPGFFPNQQSYQLPQYPQYTMGSSAGIPINTELVSHESLCGLDNVSCIHTGRGLSLQIRGVAAGSNAQEELQKSISSEVQTMAVSLPNGSKDGVSNHAAHHESPDPSIRVLDRAMEPVAIGLNSQLEPGMDFGNERGAVEECA